MHDKLAPAVERYVHHLERDEFTEAADCFSTDALFSHPPVRPGGPRIEIRGREAIRRFLADERGPSKVEHRYTGILTTEALCFTEGELWDGDNLTGSFLVSFGLDASGLIEREAAYLCIPAVFSGMTA